jgi:hypothetical protein
VTTDTQSNTRQGPIQLLANETLTGMEGRLVKLVSDSGTPKVALPDAVTDLALYLLLVGAAAGALVTIQALDADRQVRVRLNGTVAPGARVKLEAINGSNDGKVATSGTAAGVYFSPGIAEETGADEQLVLIRPDPALVTVAGTTIADLTGTLTGTVNGALVDVAAAAGACAGGSTPTAGNVDSAIATAVATIVSGVNEQNKELLTKVNALNAALKTAGIIASA